MNVWQSPGSTRQRQLEQRERSTLADMQVVAGQIAFLERSGITDGPAHRSLKSRQAQLIQDLQSTRNALHTQRR